MMGVLKASMDIDRLLAIETDHCVESYACYLRGREWSMLYTGDTRPCQTVKNYA